MTDVPAKVTVPVQSAFTSKINITQVVGIGFQIANAFGLVVTPDKQAAVAMSAALAQGVITWMFRTFFTKSVTPASVKVMA